MLVASGFLTMDLAWAPKEDTQHHIWLKSLPLGPILCFLGIFTIFLGALLKLGRRKTREDCLTFLLETRTRYNVFHADGESFFFKS